MINWIRRFTLCKIGWHKYGHDRLGWFSNDSEGHFHWGDTWACVACGHQEREQYE